MKNKLINVIKLSTQLCKSPIQCKLAYATKENFLGRSVKGYHAEISDFCLLTSKAANALCEVQNFLNQKNLGLFIFFFSKQWDQSARGVLGATFVYAFVVVYFKVF